MSEEKKQEKSTLKVNDRRRFTLEGTPRDDIQDEESEKIETPSSPEEIQTKPQEPETHAFHKETPPQEARNEAPSNQQNPSQPPSHGLDNDFNSLLISLATTAQSALGLGGPGESSGMPQSLPQAKQAIDLLEMLERKTKGNLSMEEAQILQALLYELRMLYVNAQQNSPQEVPK